MTRYVRVTPQEYETLLRFTNSMRCPPVKFPIRHPYSKSILIEEYAQREVRNVCYLGPDDGCKYLFGLSRLSDIDWSHKDTHPLYQFEAELGCKEPLTKSHNADGRPN